MYFNDHDPVTAKITKLAQTFMILPENLFHPISQTPFKGELPKKAQWGVMNDSRDWEVGYPVFLRLVQHSPWMSVFHPLLKLGIFRVIALGKSYLWFYLLRQTRAGKLILSGLLYSASRSLVDSHYCGVLFCLCVCVEYANGRQKLSNS